MITIAADSEGTTDQRVKDAFLTVELNQKSARFTRSLRLEGRLSQIKKHGESACAEKGWIEDYEAFLKSIDATIS